MKLAASPTSVRLMGGFVLILALFAAAALLSMRNFQKIIDTTDQIRELQRGLADGLLMESYARRMEVAMADLMLSEDYEHINFFKEAAENIENARRAIARFAEREVERELLLNAEERRNQLIYHFDQYFVPAVVEQDEKRIWQEREKCTELLNELVAYNRQLTAMLERKIFSAMGDALDVRYIAIRDSGILLAVATLTSVVIALLVSNSIAMPIRELTEATRNVAAGDLTKKITINRSDEFGTLAESFNKMSADLQEHQRKLVQAEKMASIGRLAAGIAHEINNPIGIILGYTSILKNEKNIPKEIQNDLKAISQEAEQCKRIVNELLNFSRPVGPGSDIFDMRKLISDVLSRASNINKSGNIVIKKNLPSRPLRVQADYERLRQAYFNIVKNAIDVMRDGGTLEVALRQSEIWDESRKKGGSSKVIETLIADSGPGIMPENIERIFEPFFTTKEEGTGLGLSIVYNAIKGYGGNISVNSRPGEGTVFRITLPLYKETS